MKIKKTPLVFVLIGFILVWTGCTNNESYTSIEMDFDKKLTYDSIQWKYDDLASLLHQHGQPSDETGETFLRFTHKAPEDSTMLHAVLFTLAKPDMSELSQERITTKLLNYIVDNFRDLDPEVYMQKSVSDFYDFEGYNCYTSHYNAIEEETNVNYEVWGMTGIHWFADSTMATLTIESQIATEEEVETLFQEFSQNITSTPPPTE